MENEPAQKRLSGPRHLITHFAWLRTRMSADRTLEAWMRTSVSLIGFGFSVEQFFDGFPQPQAILPPESPTFPHYIGLVLIGVGTVALAIAVWQYKMMLRHLHSGSFQEISADHEKPRGFQTVGVAVFLCLIGFIAFIIILTQAVP